jgi:hypothetical protein
LTRFTLAEVREQASGLLGTDLDPVGLRLMYERSGGVPFFVEELARWGGDGGLPATVRNPVLSHYQGLSPSTRHVLRLIATGGTSGAHDVVAAAFDGAAATLDDARSVSWPARTWSSFGHGTSLPGSPSGMGMTPPISPEC